MNTNTFRFGSLFMLLFIFTSCSSQNGAVKNVSVDSFLKMKSKNTALRILDVRTPAEVAEGKIQGAMTINFSQDNFDDQVNKLDKSQPIVVYCAAGGRSAKAAEIMRKQGFKEVYNLEGGIKAWLSSGQPVVK